MREILSFASDCIYFITRQGERKVTRKRSRKARTITRTWEGSKETERKQKRKEKRYKRNFQCVRILTGVSPSKKLTRRQHSKTFVEFASGGRATSIYCAQFSLGIPIVRHCWHVFPPSTMIDNRLCWCKFACTRAAYINDNGAYRGRIARGHALPQPHSRKRHTRTRSHRDGHFARRTRFGCDWWHRHFIFAEMASESKLNSRRVRASY